MEQNIVLSNRIKELMEEKGLSYNELAEKSGLPVRRVYRMANGLVSNPGIFIMIQLCKGLDLSLDEFVGTEAFDAFR